MIGSLQTPGELRLSVTQSSVYLLLGEVLHLSEVGPAEVGPAEVGSAEVGSAEVR